MLLSLLSVLFLALFSMSRTEMRSATIYSDQLEARNLADIANNVVIGQIRDATGRVGEAWASQPGAIRRYGLNGQFKAGHKLYSDSDMVEGIETDLANDLPDSNWDSAANRARYVDLNEPVVRDAGVQSPIVHFPIVDPRAADPASGNPVEGFSYSAGVNGVVTGASDARLPMPVEWLYVLHDGTVGYLDSSNTFQARTTGGAAVVPDTDNPIVGRVAFWADDESSKVNVNTASEPTYWDLPRTVSAKLSGNNPEDEDLAYAKYQPYKGEFQRYPGHPAQTALSPILFPGITLTDAQKEAIYDLVPRVVPGGSKSGTVFTQNTTGNELQPENPPHHLYASVDEFLLGVDRQAQTLVNRQQLERSRFFLTAHSSAPELNMFGLPRISIWPIDAEQRPQAAWSAFDRAMKFASTVGGRPYAFQRYDSRSPTAWQSKVPENDDLYKYAQRLLQTTIPGQGGKFMTKWDADTDQILTQSFDYIRSTNLNDQTRSNPFTSSSSDEDRGYVVPMQEGNTMGFGRYPTVSEIGIIFICSRNPSTDPESGDPARNAANTRYETQSGNTLSGNDVLVQAYVFLESFTPGQGWTDMNSRVIGRVTLRGFGIEGDSFYAKPSHTVTQKVKPGGGWHGRKWGGGQGIRGWGDGRFSSQFMRVPAGDDGTAPDEMDFSGGTVSIEIEDDNGSVIQTIEARFPDATLPVPALVQAGPDWWLSSGGGKNTNMDDGNDKRAWWAFEDVIAQVPDGNGGTRDLYGRRKRMDSTPFYPWGPATDPPSHRGGRVRANDRNRGPGKGSMVLPVDVVRSLAPHHGDYRHIAASQTVPERVFKPGYYYFDKNRMSDHTMSQEAGMHYNHGFSNGVIEDAFENPNSYSGVVSSQLTDGKYHFSKMPDRPKGYWDEDGPQTLNQNLQTGDFDNGLSVTCDGAYINKPDEGNVMRANRTGQSSNALDKDIPYFSQNWKTTEIGTTYQSPNRMVPSPVMFGSLPTGVKRDRPWETLLFRKQDSHPNSGTFHPQDHLFLDLFWMPVVEPYAISEPFATAGKINLNTQILPFGYIDRKTGLHALIGDEHMLAVPDIEAEVYKIWDHAYADYKVPDPPEGLRLPVHKEKTLEQLDTKFATGEIFRTASEICDLHIIPDTTNSGVGYTQPDASNMTAFWDAHSPTGDTSRERPYANLYPRLTTKSNAFRVHVRAQTLRKGPISASNPPDVFNPDRDNVVSEYRGSTVLERHLDPNTPGIPDYGTDLSRIGGESLDRYYQFRVIHSKRFDP